MSRVNIRFAKPHDAKRFVTDGVVSGPPPAGESWSERIEKWRSEQDAGRRAILVIFRFPPGYTEEAANGRDVAMIESLRTREHAPHVVLDALMDDAQAVAKVHHVKTVTLCLPLDNDSSIVQAKSWGFTEFRLMPESKKMFAFFRKSIV